MRLLIVEDGSGAVATALERDGHVITRVHLLSDTDEHIEEQSVDLVIVDLLLEDTDVPAWCRKVRGSGVRIPILVVAAQATVTDRVANLEAGADDFLAKPFDLSELRARIRAIARRGVAETSPETVRGAVSLDLSARRARVGGLEVALTRGEWSIIELLEARAGNVVLRDDLIEGVNSDSATVEVLVGRIRKKLGADYIRTIRGRGYSVG